MIMETQKIVNLVDGNDNEKTKYPIKKWYVVDSESKSVYSQHVPINVLTKSLEWSLCDYSDTYILVTRNITSGGNDAKAAFKNCPPLKDGTREINDTLGDHRNVINITMPMYDLIEYSDNHSDTSGSLFDFIR